MDTSSRASGAPLAEPDIARFQSDNVMRLLVERHHIWAKLYNPGTSVALRATARVDHNRPLEYSTEIGNGTHLDLIDLDMEIKKYLKRGAYTKSQIISLLLWVDSMSEEQAAMYLHARGSTRLRYPRRDFDRTEGTVPTDLRPVSQDDRGVPCGSP